MTTVWLKCSGGGEVVCSWCGASRVLFMRLFGDGSAVWLASSFLARWSVARSGSTSASARCGWWLIYVMKRDLLRRLRRGCMVTS